MMNKLKYYAFRVLFCAVLIPILLAHWLLTLPLYYVVEAINHIRGFIIDNIGLPLIDIINKLNRYQCKLNEKAKNE